MPIGNPALLIIERLFWAFIGLFFISAILKFYLENIKSNEKLNKKGDMENILIELAQKATKKEQK